MPLRCPRLEPEAKHKCYADPSKSSGKRSNHVVKTAALSYRLPDDSDPCQNSKCDNNHLIASSPALPAVQISHCQLGLKRG
jgi:hypothetical protein